MSAPQDSALQGGPRPAATGRALVAEDNPVNQTLARVLLERRGWSVVSVTDGVQAVEALRHATFDLVLMDVQMPGLDGYEATAIIRREEQQGRMPSRHVPILGVTAHVNQADRDRCLAVGMDGYVVKPIEQHALYAAIERALAQVPSGNEPPPADLSGLLDSIGSDSDLLAELIASFRIDHRDKMQRLQAAVGCADASAVERAAHAFKGALAVFGAHQAMHLCAEMERLASQGDLSRARELLEQLQAEVPRVLAHLERMTASQP